MVVNLARLEAIFSEALGLSAPSERALFLDRTCGSDADLRMKVERLLASADAAGNFMAPPSADQTVDSRNSVHERPGSKISHYTLLEKIGEGGFGVVFMAEQERPVRRKVALKIIKLGMDTKQVVARFEAERQALAMMDHPNIAKVLDAGSTESGRPFFVMDLVKGVPITEYCDQQATSTRERLALFVDVCNAIQHAHQRGIIHRDIKPSNVLLTLHDNRAVPKIIDFGIAKATQARLTEKTLFTEFRQLLGTPAYMSPEQAQMIGMDIDTRSDIYSLGVMLYELLTGSTPFDARQLSGGGLDEMRRIIREVEPPPPSSRLSTLGADRLVSVAHQRRSDPQRLGRLVKGDLDLIVMRCLEKDRTRRYDTAVGLAEDIQRHLSDQPVQARPPTLAYRTKKFVRRNRIGVLAATAISIAILFGLTLATIGFIQARRQTEIARKEEARSRQTAQFLTDMLKGVGPSVALGRDTTMLREIVDKTAERIGTDLKEQPEVEVALRLTLARVYRDLQLYQKMEEVSREVIRVARVHFGEQNPAVADALGLLGQALMYLRKTDEAEPVTRQSIALQRALRGDDSLEVASGQQVLGDVLRYQAFRRESTVEGNAILEEAESALKSCVAIRRQRLQDDNDEVVVALIALCQVLDAEGKPAESTAREALEIARRLFGDEHPQTANCWVQLGGIQSRAIDRLAEAEANLRKGLHLQIKTQGENKFNQAYTNWALGGVLDKQGKLDEAETCFQAAVSIARAEMGADHSDMPMFLGELASLLHRRGKLNESRQVSEEAIAICLRSERIDPHWRQHAFDALAYVLRKQGDTAEIEALAGRWIAHAEASGSADRLAEAYAAAIPLLMWVGRQNEADHDCQIFQGLAHKNGRAFERLARFLATAENPAFRRPVLAVELAKKAVELNPRDGRLWTTLGAAHYRAGECQTAVEALAKSMALRDGGDAGEWFLLAMTHWKLGDDAAARMWFERAVEWSDAHQTNNEAIRRFQAEANELFAEPLPATQP